MDPAQLGAVLEGLRGYFDLLAERFPEVADDANLVLIREMLANRCASSRAGTNWRARWEGLAARFETVEEPYVLPTMFLDLLAEVMAGADDESAAQLGMLVANHLNDDATPTSST